MKDIYLIANAHIDPIWQWELEEGLNCAVATFESALNLMDRYDYVFCHNEAILYEHIERVRPDLFVRIEKKIREGKWHIMGGWYLQPDCRLPSGESFVRQIRYGLRFFSKFGYRPRVAANLDSFGHSKGIVQILVKSGYKGYLFQRPQKYELELENDRFNWQGMDRYNIPTVRINSGYNSSLGKVAEKIRDQITKQCDEKSVLVMWGVGNHGGGPSASDLEQICAISKELEDGYVIHSATPEQFFSGVNFSQCPTFSGSLDLTMPGCLTSLARLKLAHRELENMLYSTEKLLSAAALQTDFLYEGAETNEAAKALMLSEFHDVLPGTCIRDAEKEMLESIGYGKHLLRKLRTQALNSLALKLTPTAPGDYCVLVFNPHPYPLSQTVKCEIMLADQNFGEKIKTFSAFVDGKQIPVQPIKERSNVALDWRRGFALNCTLQPSSLTHIVLRECAEHDKKTLYRSAKGYVFDNGSLRVEFGKSGFIESVSVGGKILMSSSLRIIETTDTGDSWAMLSNQRRRLGDITGEFRLMNGQESAKYSGTGGKIAPLRIVEDGEILTMVEGMYKFDDDLICCSYTFYRGSTYFDMNVRLFFNGADKCVKLDFPIGRGDAFAEIAYGLEKINHSGAEQHCGKFVYCDGVGIINNGIGGCSCENGRLYLNLVRGAGYATHPVFDRKYVPSDRFIERMDQGVTEFAFRICPGAELKSMSAMALAFNEAPYAAEMSVSLLADGMATEGLRLSNPDIVLTTHKRSQDVVGKMLIRLHNNFDQSSSTDILVGGKKLLSLRFDAFEIKTVLYDKTNASEIEELLI